MNILPNWPFYGFMSDIAIAVLGGLIAILLVAIWNRISGRATVQLRRAYDRLVRMIPLLRQVTIGLTGAIVAVLLWNGIHLQNRLSKLEEMARQTQAATADLQKRLSASEASSEALTRSFEGGLSGLKEMATEAQDATANLSRRLFRSEEASEAMTIHLKERLSKLETIAAMESMETSVTELRGKINLLANTSEENASEVKDNTTTSKLETMVVTLFEYPNIYTREEFYEKIAKDIGINVSYYNAFMDRFIKQGLVETDETGKIMIIIPEADD